jgi:hypothetical protein
MTCAVDDCKRTMRTIARAIAQEAKKMNLSKATVADFAEAPQRTGKTAEGDLNNWFRKKKKDLSESTDAVPPAITLEPSVFLLC